MSEERRKGSDIVIDVLRSEGITHIFGNPGTTELPLIDALAAVSDIHYVLGLQEATVVGMADGYAQATRRPAFINLHTAAGLGNAIGNLTNAKVANTPLVVTAGQQDQRHLVTDPMLSGNLVGLAAPVSKWAHEVQRHGDLGIVLRRAFHDAASAPAGPVFVSLPMNLLDEIGPASIPPPSRLERASVGGSLDELARLLAETPPGRLMIAVGDEASMSGATRSVVALAEALGAPVYGFLNQSTFPFPTAHQLWAGHLVPHAGAMRAALSGYDRVFLIAGRGFTPYPYFPGPVIPAAVELLHLSPDPHELGRNYAVRLGIVGDPAATLDALLPLVQPKVDRARARESAAQLGATHQAARDRQEAAVQGRYGETPIPPAVAAHAVLRALPANAVVVDEGAATTAYLHAFHRVTEPGRFFFIRAGGLGWGMPAALGVSLGYGREPVLCMVGDGAAMYSPQALWTAAHERLPVVYVVMNNREYNILKNNMRGMEGYNATVNRFIGMDIDDPAVNFVALARSMGVPGTTVTRTSEIGEAVRAAWQTGAPHLIEVMIGKEEQGGQGVTGRL